jgi:hypothetical protein
VIGADQTSKLDTLNSMGSNRVIVTTPKKTSHGMVSVMNLSMTSWHLVTTVVYLESRL